MKNTGETAGVFLNVDLEVFSSEPLDELARAFGESVVVMFLGRQHERYLAALELADSGLGQSADHLLKEFVRRIRNLDPSAHSVWARATARQFDIGVEQTGGVLPFALLLEQSTVASIAEVNGTIAFTIYPKRDNSAFTP